MKHKHSQESNYSRPKSTKDLHTLYLAGGCFWGLEAYLKRLPGIHNTEVGYANGSTSSPTYEDVCYRSTGHAETVAVTYDRTIMTTEALLDAFFKVVDPTTLNRQGNDRGTQYRSGIYYLDKSDIPLIRASIDRQKELYKKPIYTEVKPLLGFSKAEEYHQDYLTKNPNGYCHIDLGLASEYTEALEVNTPDFSYSIPLAVQGDTPDDILNSLIVARNYHAPDDKELRKKLGKEQYRVTQENATEFPYANEYNDNFDKGLYVDITSGEPLFTSMDKFESGCGWPSFSRPIVSDVLTEHDDRNLFTTRTEVRSRAGNSHLGHVFKDGPSYNGGLRYCINSAALRFIPYTKLEEEGYGYLKYLFDRDRSMSFIS